MTAKEIIRYAMTTREMRQEDLAKIIGYASQSGVARVLNRDGGMTVTNLVRMLSGLGYELTVVDKLSGETFGIIDDFEPSV